MPFFSDHPVLFHHKQLDLVVAEKSQVKLRGLRNVLIKLILRHGVAINYEFNKRAHLVAKLSDLEY